MRAVIELRAERYDHPDAVALTDQAQRYYVTVYGGPDDDPLAAADFEPPGGCFLIGYLGGRAVVMGGWLWSPDVGPRAARIRRMFVDPALRRQGCGATLLAALERDAYRRGAELMVLATGQPQNEAVALYRAAGYADIAPFGHYADSSQAVHLAKQLAPAG